MEIDLGKWVRAARQNKGLTQEELALELGFSTKASVSAIETGKNNPTFDTMVKIAHLCSYPLPYQTRSKGDSEGLTVSPISVWDDENLLPKGDFVFLPYYKDVILRAEAGSFINMMEATEKIAFSRAVLEKGGIAKDSAICIAVTGNSMEPMLPNGTTVVVNMADTEISDGKLYAIRHGDLVRVKRLYRLPNNTVRINSYNQEEHPDELLILSEIEIIGKVFSWTVTAL